MAQLKLAAGLLGLPLDVMIQRQQEREKGERFWWRATAAALAVVAIGAASTAYHSYRTTQRANALIDSSIRSTAELVKTTGRVRDDMGVPAAAVIELLKGIELQFSDFESYDPRNPKVRLQRASMLLDFARNYGKLKLTAEQGRMARLALAELDELRGTPKIEEASLTLEAEAHRQLGDAYYGDGRYQKALAEFEEGLRINGEADKFYAERNAPRAVLGTRQYVGRARLLLGYAGTLTRLDRKPEALSGAAQAISMARDLPLDHRNGSDHEALELLIDARYQAADLIRQMNDRRMELAAEAYINDGLSGAERLHALNPERARLRRKIATMHLARGDFRRWRADREGALEDYQASRSHRERLAKADPSDLTLKAEFAFSLIKTGEELNALRRSENAIPELEIAEKLYGELRSARPQDRSFRHWQWTTLQGLGDAYRLLGNSTKAIDYHRRKLVVARAQWEQEPGGINSRWVLAESYRDYADALIARGNVRDGMENLSAAHELLEAILGDPQVDWRLLRLQAQVLESIARGELSKHDYEAARIAAARAYAHRERDLVRSGKIDPHGQSELAENRRLVGSIELANAKCGEAKENYERAVAILDKLVGEHDTPNPEWLERYAAARKSLDAITWKDGSHDCCEPPVDGKVREMIAVVARLLLLR